MPGQGPDLRPGRVFFVCHASKTVSQSACAHQSALPLERRRGIMGLGIEHNLFGPERHMFEGFFRELTVGLIRAHNEAAAIAR